MNFNAVFKALSLSFKQYPAFIKRYGLLIFALFIPFEIIEQNFLRLASSADDSMRLTFNIAGTINSLMQALVIVTSIPYLAAQHIKEADPHLTVHWKEHLVQVTIESFRAMARIFLGFILLVIPGFVLTIWYYFVPYVTQFNQKYLDGDLDALHHSRVLVRGKSVAILVFVTAFTLVIFGLDLEHLRFNIFTNIKGWAAITLLVFIVDSFAGLTTLNLYQELEKEIADEPDV